MSAASTGKACRAIPVTIVALASFLMVLSLASTQALADDKPWQDPDRIATTVEIDDSGIVIHTESKDGGDVEVIEIPSETRDSDLTIRSKRCRDRSSCGVKTRIEWNLSDLDDIDWIDIDDCDDAIIQFGEDIHVGRREVIRGDLVAIGGSIYIEGEVEGDVVALGGSVTLGPRATVEGDVVAVSGDVLLDRGAEIDGDAVSVGGEIDDDGAHIDGDTVLIDFSLW